MALVRATPQFLVGTSGSPELGFEFNGTKAPVSMSRVIGRIGIPFLIMPGDGASTGCIFSGTDGAFTLSAAILSLSSSGFAGCYSYFSANFGGSSLPAGWYWTEFSTDTAGIVYAYTYVGGPIKRPTNKAAISTNLTGRITATTNEVSIPAEFLLPAGLMGKNGILQITTRQLASTGGTKTYRLRSNDASLSQLFNSTTAGSTVGDSINYVSNLDSDTEKYLGRFSVPTASVGQFGATLISGYKVSTCDTSVDNKLYFTMQGSTSTAAPALMGASIIATYGE